MKQLNIIAIILIALPTISYTQECKTNIVTNLRLNLQSSNIKFNKQITKSLKKILPTELDKNTYSVIIIPTINYKKSIVKIDPINKDLFLCYLNYKNLTFETAFIIIDSTLVGAVMPCPSKDCKLRYLDNSYPYTAQNNFLSKLLYNIKPEMVFYVKNLPNTCWYIKCNNLFVITYKYSQEKLYDFQIIPANKYISEILTENDIIYLK